MGEVFQRNSTSVHAVDQHCNSRFFQYVLVFTCVHLCLMILPIVVVYIVFVKFTTLSNNIFYASIVCKQCFVTKHCFCIFSLYVFLHWRFDPPPWAPAAWGGLQGHQHWESHFCPIRFIVVHSMILGDSLSDVICEKVRMSKLCSTCSGSNTISRPGCSGHHSHHISSVHKLWLARR